MSLVNRFLFAALLLLALAPAASAEVLIVADEFPAMETLAAKLKHEEKIESKIVWQTNLPPSLKPFSAVIVYIHRGLSNNVETSFINYARSGGKLVLVHHSISSGKRKNEFWFPFLGVSLPEGDFDKGGYKYVEPANWTLVNLAPAHFIMTNKLKYPDSIPYTSTNLITLPGELPGFSLADDEVYLNQILIGPHTLLMGLKYTDEKTGVTYMQDTAGWLKPADKGWIIYLMPGHRQLDFTDPVFSRIVVNAVIYQP